MKPLTRSFYERRTTVVAFELIGKFLVFHQGRNRLAGRIVETEAYLGADDPASHAYRGVTPRNRVMFGPAGFSYVYFTYGVHYCFNIVTEKNGVPGAVLIRAVQPLAGISVMEQRRKQVSRQNLTNGPAKLTQAFGISKQHLGHDLTAEPLYVTDEWGGKAERFGSHLNIQATTRIGIRRGKGMMLRFCLVGNPFVSVP